MQFPTLVASPIHFIPESKSKQEQLLKHIIVKITTVADQFPSQAELFQLKSDGKEF